MTVRLAAAAALTALVVPAPAPAALAENGRLAYVSDRSGDYDIYAQELDGSGLANLTEAPGVDQSPAWSPDGRRIAFTSFRDGRQAVFVMNADGSEQRRVSPPSDFADDATPAWSPDGSRLAFASTRPFGDAWGVWTMNADGTGLARVQTGGPAVDPAWSPDGSWIAYSGFDPSSGTSAISVVNVDDRNGGPIRVTSGQFSESAPSWSPDGRWLVFGRYRGGNVQELVMASPFQAGEQTITWGGYFDANPVWSPDMRWILFQRHPGTASQARALWIVSTGGGDAVPLDALPGGNGEPDWAVRGAAPPPPPPVDKAPEISIGVPFETSYLLNAAYATSFSCRDGDGPPPSCKATVTWEGGSASLAPGDPLPTGSVGAHHFSVTARDAGGNESTQERWYWVVYATTNVFAAPLAPFPQFSEWKAGQELPVRFGITGFHGLDVLRGAPVSRRVPCEAPEFGQWGDATSGKLHYNATNDRYTYVWETDRAWADTCRQFVLTLDDTSYWYAYVRLTK